MNGICCEFFYSRVTNSIWYFFISDHKSTLILIKLIKNYLSEVLCLCEENDDSKIKMGNQFNLLRIVHFSLRASRVASFNSLGNFVQHDNAITSFLCKIVFWKNCLFRYNLHWKNFISKCTDSKNWQEEDENQWGEDSK